MASPSHLNTKQDQLHDLNKNTGLTNFEKGKKAGDWAQFWSMAESSSPGNEI